MQPTQQNTERISLEERQRMTDVERLRHSAAHVMAAAIAQLWPEAQFAAGPAVENGFYYDVELAHRITPDDFAAIETEMKKLIKENHVFERIVVDRDQALADARRGRLGALSDRPVPSKFKLDILEGIPAGEQISYFKSGEFIDLCAGPHVMRTGNIGAFKLTSVASAYYKGDEKNPQLQRIYGTAFKTRKELDAHFAMIEEAKKRDHRKLGAEMGLYVIDTEYVGPGLPLWLPMGTTITEELEKLAKETEFAAGYVRVRTPHLAKEKMYRTSGHLPYYEESMFPPMEVRESGAHAPARAVSGASPESSQGARYSKRNLPHFERPWAKYAVSFSTHDRRQLTPAERDIVLSSIVFGHEHRQYELFAACVMPDHVHMLFEPQIKTKDDAGNPVFHSLTEILQGVKSSTAHRINKASGQSGLVWDKECFDRLIRSDADLEEKFNYICRTPWDSGVVRLDQRYPWMWTAGIQAGEAPATAREGACAPHDAQAGEAPAPAREGACAPHDAQAGEEPVDRYYMKAMNCPHHHRIFAAEPRSYRDLPLRLAEYGTCYRYEQSGELFGLMRVRSMNMNDAHIYCTPDQFAAEFNAVNEMYLKYFKIFGIEKYVMRFSTHGKEGLGKKYVNEPELWVQTEDLVRDVLRKSGINYVEVADEAAFYGPKIDVQVWSVIGREFTLATNQVDFAVPKRFGLTYRDRDNTDKTPLCIHRAPLSTHERFIGFLLEHYAGNFPLWLAPNQVRVLPVTDAQMDYAKGIVDELRSRMVRAELEFSNDKLMGRIQRAEEARVHHILVVGQREQESASVAVRVHGKGQQGVKARAEVVADILTAVRERSGDTQ